MSEPSMSLPPSFQVEVPDAVVAGHYADFARIWHTPDAFVLDFAAVKDSPRPGQDEYGKPVAVVPAQVVARVKVPPSQVFELMRALEVQLSKWEREKEQRNVPPAAA